MTIKKRDYMLSVLKQLEKLTFRKCQLQMAIKITPSYPMDEVRCLILDL